MNWRKRRFSHFCRRVQHHNARSHRSLLVYQITILGAGPHRAREIAIRAGDICRYLFDSGVGRGSAVEFDQAERGFLLSRWQGRVMAHEDPIGVRWFRRNCRGRRARQQAANVAGRAAVGAAAEEAGVAIGSRGALLLLGRGVLIMTGWEVALAVVAIQFLIWYFSDDDLQTWLEKCAFGRKPANPVWDAGKQSDEFEKALKVMGLSTD